MSRCVCNNDVKVINNVSKIINNILNDAEILSKEIQIRSTSLLILWFSLSRNGGGAASGHTCSRYVQQHLDDGVFWSRRIKYLADPRNTGFKFGRRPGTDRVRAFELPPCKN